MLDRERILVKLDELDGYLRELRAVVPATLEGYRQIEKRRSCERLLQIAVESVIDICNLLVAGLRLGLPADAARKHRIAAVGRTPSRVVVMLSIANSGANASRRCNLLAVACQACEPLVQSRQSRFFGREAGCLSMNSTRVPVILSSDRGRRRPPSSPSICRAPARDRMRGVEHRSQQ